MKAQDINLRDLLDFQPQSGRLLLRGQRMLIFSQDALRTLNGLLVEHLGHEFAGAVFMQFGHRCGQDDYQVIAGGRVWDSDEDRLASGPVTHMWEGIVHVTATVTAYDRATGDFLMTGEWRHSFEAENHLETYGISEVPVCSSLVGYASGWASAFFDAKLLAIETACAAQGEDHCTFEIRPFDEWDERADAWKRALSATADSVSSLLEQRVRDRTRDLEQLNEVLEEARGYAERANRTKSQFLANMSHELRTPMNGVIGIAQLLRESGLDARQKDLVDLIIESGDQQVAIISDLLDYSKIEAGQMSVDTTPFDLHALLAGAVATFRSQAWGKGLSLELDVDDSVPAAVASDPLKINQILTNLLSNAVKFTPSGGQVLVRASSIGTEVELSVADSGIGMTEEQIGIVLVPFSQGDASITRRYGGTGLGLAICKDLVDLLGGRLEFTSKDGEGSTFRVLLPFERASAAATDTSSGEPGHDFEGSDVLDVLVAEDNRVNARVITALLESSGCRPTVVPDGAQAVAEYTARAFDLVVLDLHMPVMDGISVAEFIRAHEREHGIPAHKVVALTADVHEATRRRCVAAGFSEFLTKPVGKPEVLRMVAQARELRLSRAAGQ